MISTRLLRTVFWLLFSGTIGLCLFSDLQAAALFMLFSVVCVEWVLGEREAGR